MNCKCGFGIENNWKLCPNCGCKVVKSVEERLSIIESQINNFLSKKSKANTPTVNVINTEPTQSKNKRVRRDFNEVIVDCVRYVRTLNKPIGVTTLIKKIKGSVGGSTYAKIKDRLVSEKFHGIKTSRKGRIVFFYPSHVKNPKRHTQKLNPFFDFLAKERPILKQEFPNMNAREQLKILGDKWNNRNKPKKDHNEYMERKKAVVPESMNNTYLKEAHKGSSELAFPILKTVNSKNVPELINLLKQLTHDNNSKISFLHAYIIGLNDFKSFTEFLSEISMKFQSISEYLGVKNHFKLLNAREIVYE